MEVLTPKSTRRSTRIRVEIPVTVTSLDRLRPYAERCVALVISAQGCGFRSSRALPTETPIMLSDLPAGGSVTARVANCLPLGSDGKYFLIGAALYTHGNVWGIADPPQDWESSPQAAAADGAVGSAQPAVQGSSTNAPSVSKKVWPYNLFAESSEAQLGKK
jgi:hypothetical protein